MVMWWCQRDGAQQTNSVFVAFSCKPVAACPTPDVVDALRHPGLKQVDISRSTPSIHLRVIRVEMRMEAMVVDQ